jgi:hypothetical protein
MVLSESGLRRTGCHPSVRVSHGSRQFSWHRTTVCAMNRAGHISLRGVQADAIKELRTSPESAIVSLRAD